MTKAAELAKMGEVLTNSQIGGRRNIAYNGAMQVAQRGTSSTGITSGTSNFVVDRFPLRVGSQGTWTMSQATDTPDGFSNSLKLDCTTADATTSASDQIRLTHKFEGQDLQQFKFGSSSASNMTLSFWVKSNKTGTYTLEFFNNDDSRTISVAYTISSASTWEKKTITIDGDTSGSFDNDNNNSLEIIWWLAAGSDFNGGTFNTTWSANVNANRVSSSQVNLADSTSNEWYITGIQLEVGEQATPFEHRSFGEELSLCQRYFSKYSGSGSFMAFPFSGFAGSTTAGEMVGPFPTTMRSSPTASVNGGSNFRILHAGTDQNTSAISVDFTSLNACRLSITSSSLTAGQAIGLINKSGTLAEITFDSEL